MTGPAHTETETKDAPPRWNAKPPNWLNRFMSATLKLPALHRMVSGSILELEFTGRKSGTQYSTPVSYVQMDGPGSDVLVMTKRFRSWWRNFTEPAPVMLRLAGKRLAGTATAITDVERLTDMVAQFLAIRARDAAFYGVTLDKNHHLTHEQAAELAKKVVIIRVTLD